MTKAQEILKDSKYEQDTVMICEFWAVNIDFHENKTEYFFKDDSSVIIEINHD